MKKITASFEKDEALSHIDVLFRASERDNEVEAAMRRVLNQNEKKLAVTSEDGSVTIIKTDEIISASVRGKQVLLTAESGVYYSQTALQSIEKELDDELFVRISRYEIVNTEKIRRFDFTLNGTLRIELAGGISTWASRRSIPLIRKKIFGKEREMC